ncbi:MAG: hypothetical protein ACM357_11215, partial [Gemmatimonadota bacterium]
GDSLVVGTLDAGTGRFRRLRAFDPDSLDTFEALPDGGIVHYSLVRDRVYRALAPNRPDTSFALPEGLTYVTALEPSPDGTAVAVAGYGDFDSDSLILSVLSLEDGSSRRIAGMVGERMDNPRWLPDGSVIVPVFETAGTLALYRGSVRGGPFVRLGPVPRFPGSYRFSADGRRGIIRAADEPSDVHVLRNFRAIVEAR